MIKIGLFFTFIIGFLIVVILLLSIISNFSKNPWFCKFWGWHKAPKTTKQSGINTRGICPRCIEEVMQDSQGNWF